MSDKLRGEEGVREREREGEREREAGRQTDRETEMVEGREKEFVRKQTNLRTHTCIHVHAHAQ